MVELMVAVGVVLALLLSLAYVATIGFSDIALARQRQGANGLANQTIEQVSALPFDRLRAGLDNTDIVGDPNIVACAADPASFCYPNATGERVPTGDTTVVEPLNPHISTVTVGPTAYTVSTYLTYLNDDPTSNAFRITVIVEWANPARRGVASRVETQTIRFSGQGCLSTATHPFAGPCQPFFYGNASAAQGLVEITGTIEDVQQFQSASLLFPWATSTLQIEQISAIQGIAETSAALMDLTTSQPTSGGQRQTSGADNDPGQPGQEYDSKNVLGSASPLSAQDGNGLNSITVSPSTGDAGTTTSTTSASIGNACPVVGLSETDQQSCGHSTIQQVTASTAVLRHAKRTDFGSATLFSALVPAGPSTSFSHREVQANQDGLVHSTMSRQVGTVTIGGLPSNLPPTLLPVGWLGHLIQITGFSDTVVAETGTNSTAPSVATTGVLSYWNGSGYSTINLAPGAPVEVPVASLTIVGDFNGQPLLIEIHGSRDSVCDTWVDGCPTTGGTSTSEAFLTCSPACPDTRTQASAKSNSPFVGTIYYRIQWGSNELAELEIDVDLGTITAQNTYQQAPSS